MWQLTPQRQKDIKDTHCIIKWLGWNHVLKKTLQRYYPKKKKKKNHHVNPPPQNNPLCNSAMLLLLHPSPSPLLSCQHPRGWGCHGDGAGVEISWCLVSFQHVHKFASSVCSFCSGLLVSLHFCGLSLFSSLFLLLQAVLRFIDLFVFYIFSWMLFVWFIYLGMMIRNYNKIAQYYYGKGKKKICSL